ncbi:hypothetical protein EA473_14190 [Natrarchaeobius chitinivorans]|uniref:Uncharacterized protein n=1 Tax=Natrarchaeobius chitinivorans TaxID=1679083 RepID=A0A3N6M0N1_NATCH|nr:hypothetical protein EA473_14190 [Natrarchaeobius chitinivorans]
MAVGRSKRLLSQSLHIRPHIVTTGTIYTLIAQLSCDQVCIDFQWLLYPSTSLSPRNSGTATPVRTRDHQIV